MRSQKIRLRNMRLNTLMGVYPEEREAPRPLVLNVELEVNLEPGCRTDDVADTFSYEPLYYEICELVQQSSYRLIEALAHAVAECCLRHSRVSSAVVTVDKPGVFEHLDSVAVTIALDRTPQRAGLQ